MTWRSSGGGSTSSDRSRAPGTHDGGRERDPAPGIGIRYEFDTQDGDRVAVVHHRSGVRRARFVRGGDPDASRPVAPRARGRRTLAELLGLSQVAKELSELERDVEGLAVDRLPLAAASPFDGEHDRRHGGANAHGVSIVAVLRGDEAHPAGPRVRPAWRRHTRRRGDASGDRGTLDRASLGVNGARLGVPARARRGHPAPRDPGSGRAALGVLAHPALPPRGAGVRPGRDRSARHRGSVHRGGRRDRADPVALSLGLEYSARELVVPFDRPPRSVGPICCSTSRRGSWRGCCSVGGSSPRSSWEA